MRLLPILMLIATSSAAHATQDQWPALFDVSGVATGDVLNVRAAPDASSEIVATLAPDATNVEVVRPNERVTWGLVNVGERAGWVSLNYLARQPGQWLGAQFEAARCYGTEPFWGFEFDAGGGARWTDPEQTGTAPAEGTVLQRLSTIAARDVQGVVFSGSDGREGVALMTLQACRDGMSNREYGIRASVVLRDSEGASLHSGCCSLD